MSATLVSMIVGMAAVAPSSDATAAPDICTDQTGLLYADLVDQAHQVTAMPTQAGLDALPATGATVVSFDRLMTQNRVCPVADFASLSRASKLEAIVYLPVECLPALARTAKLPALREIDIACGDGTAVDLRPLAAFPALAVVLTRLNCRYGPGGVAPLAALPRLRTFIDDGIARLEGLETLTKLTGLALGSERGTVPPLAKLPALRAVRLIMGAPRDLAQLGDLPALEELIILSPAGLQGVIDVTPLARLTSLRRLEIHASKVANGAALAGLRGLCRLELGNVHEPIDIATLATFKELRRLTVNVRGSPVLAPLARLKTLEALHLTSDCVRSSIDLAPLARLPRLSSITLYGPIKAVHLERLAGKVVHSGQGHCGPKPGPCCAP